MPAKYVIHSKAAPPRFRAEGKLGIVDWREDCSSCHNCVKKSCVYGFYRDEADSLHDELGYLDYIYQCKGCLTCIQDCTKNILTRVVNPEYEKLGDEHYTPEVLLTTWYQAESGRIPVSGSGYGGKFSGPGFDSMWTDMSEIVRPTRDGIHGREYINTGMELGRKLPHLSFENGGLTVDSPPLIESPMPLMFDIIQEHWNRGPVLAAISEAAAEMGLFAAVNISNISDSSNTQIVPVVEDTSKPVSDKFSSNSLIMVPDCAGVFDIISSLKKENSNRIVVTRVNATPEVASRTVELAKGGAEVIHLGFTDHGFEKSDTTPRHMRDVLCDVHEALTKAGIRDEIELIASGGIALPEHMAKAIICGADMVAVDIPLILALECRLCLECKKGELCQIKLDEIDREYATQRIINLIAAWRNQLLELLGAMGIREVRRLRGERGRSMFFEDLEREAFGRLFGKRIEKSEGKQ